VTENYIEHAAGEGGDSSSRSHEEEDDALASFRYAIPSKKTEKDSLTRLDSRYFSFLFLHCCNLAFPGMR
jgi:hypothetical protein